MDIHEVAYSKGVVNAGPVADPSKVKQSVPQSVSQSPTESVTDTASFSKNALEVAKYAEKARSLPETRSEVVQAYHDQLKKTNYPPPALVEGMMSLVGIDLASQVEAYKKLSTD